ncbi:hypothetical protein ACH5RR_038518 [Cinchona calisaya]|uniref:Uncharacterized protein n=1 Tax=Cinchona calisaya TaxID=153742 RepID=A0ABD2XZM0_9GENT
MPPQILLGQLMIRVAFVSLFLSKPAHASFSSPATKFPIAKRGCNDTCGDVKIPYPFGIGQGCYLDEGLGSFGITCNSSYNPPKAFLKDTKIDITEISPQGQLNVLQFIARECYDHTLGDEPRADYSLPKFAINRTSNKLIGIGCDTSTYAEGIRFQGHKNMKHKIRCISTCDTPNAVINGSCSGSGCCQASIPKGMKILNLTVRSVENHIFVRNFSPCSYAFFIQKSEFNFYFDNLTNLERTEKLPLVLNWAIGDENQTCETAKQNLSSYACQNNTICINGEGNYTGYRCSCKEGYQGNPYLTNNGCQDINECQMKENNSCKFKDFCHNFEGGYNCSCPEGYTINGDGKGSEGCIPRHKKHHQLLAGIITAGIMAGNVALLAFCSWCYNVYKKRKMTTLREKFFRDNGGLILQKKIKGQEESSSYTTKIFSIEGLKKATNNFHDSKIIGQGGFGIVYKGCLPDKREVAIKKSKLINHNQIEQFINEVVILSQVNHKNVVKLLGCCLETEVPLLVYEFINNGTLFKHLDDKHMASEICWDIRLKIAAETAEALSYLHSAASPPIIHRDIKTTNILLDKNYTARVSDFGASRLGPLDDTQFSTMVQGTRGYLDPEFFQTFQLTEKSDVYSFGVVLVELLTGKKPVCFERSEGEISLSHHFLSSMKENRLLEILEDRIVCEGNIEQLKQVASLAEQCLNVKGEDRLPMQHIAMELMGLRIASKHNWVQSANVEELSPLIDQQNQMPV